MAILYLSQQTNTCSKAATETSEITDDNPNKNILKKQPLVAFYKERFLKYSAKLIGKTPVLRPHF